MCTQHYFNAYVQCLQPVACLLLHRNASHTDTTLQIPLTLATALSVFIRLWCMDNKISWLRGGLASGVHHITALSEVKHEYFFKTRAGTSGRESLGDYSWEWKLPNIPEDLRKIYNTCRLPHLRLTPGSMEHHRQD